ncbi:MAG: helix-turn-helix transcriptional regulator [Ruminiclostridium sp.]|nr:helix-turn-helix transcriptional regulator [Ruminiclostridium sp.]MBR1832131.1 helix-turn-helix transcriptional regulator [Ruminiclostridium sp.]
MYNRIRDLREDNDKKQKEIAAYLCCSQQAYSNYELGMRDIPPDILIKLADLYSTNVDYILGLTNNKTYYKNL